MYTREASWVCTLTVAAQACVNSCGAGGAGAHQLGRADAGPASETVSVAPGAGPAILWPVERCGAIRAVGRRRPAESRGRSASTALPGRLASVSLARRPHHINQSVRVCLCPPALSTTGGRRPFRGTVLFSRLPPLVSAASFSPSFRDACLIPDHAQSESYPSLARGDL